MNSKEYYSECYWDNLDTIRIVTKSNRGKLSSEDIVKITMIGKNANHSWRLDTEIMTKENFDKLLIKDIYTFSTYRLVPDFIFPRAFKDIYAEMSLQFSLLGDQESLDKLENMFKLPKNN